MDSENILAKFKEKIQVITDNKTLVDDNDKKILTDHFKNLVHNLPNKIDLNQYEKLLRELLDNDDKLTNIFENIIKDNTTNDKLTKSIKNLNKQMFILQMNAVLNLLSRLKSMNISSDTFNNLINGFYMKFKDMTDILQESSKNIEKLEGDIKDNEEIISKLRGISHSIPRRDIMLGTYSIVDIDKYYNLLGYKSKSFINNETQNKKLLLEMLKKSAISKKIGIPSISSEEKNIVGGGEDDNDLELFFDKIYTYFNILNTSLYLKMMTLLNIGLENDKKISSLGHLFSFVGNESIINNFHIFIKNLFFKFTKSDFQFFTSIHDNYEFYINKDTEFYNTIIGEEKSESKELKEKEEPISRESDESTEEKKIELKSSENTWYHLFIFKILYDIKKSFYTGKFQIFFSGKNFPLFIKITDYVIKIIEDDRLTNQYNIFNGNYVSINEEYFKYVKSKNTRKVDSNNYNNKIYSFVKIRKDSDYKNDDVVVKTLTSNDRNYIFVKYNLIKKINTEYYYFGPFNDIFYPNQSNKDIADKLDLIKKKILGYENVCVVGYGQSGAGKTSSLIYFDKKQQDGILMELCSNDDIIKNFSNLTISLIEIIVDYNKINVNQPTHLKQDNYKKKFYENKEKKFTSDDKQIFNFNKIEDNGKTNWFFNNEKITLGNFINDALKSRKIEPTPNNPESSRSHVIIVITFKNEPNEANMIMCDFAGVENKFNCDNIKVLQDFLNKYKEKYKKLSENNLKEKIKLENNNIYLKKINYLDSEYENMKKVYEKIIGDQLGQKKITINKYDSDDFGDISKLNETIFFLILTSLFINDKDITNKMLSRTINDNLKNIIYDKFNDKLKIYGLDEVNQDDFDKIFDRFLEIMQFKNIFRSKTKNFKFAPNYQNIIKKTKDDYKDDLIKLAKKKLTYLLIKHNCLLRVLEGYTINDSLRGLRKDIKSLILKSINNMYNITPLMFYVPDIPFCTDTTLYNNRYDEFYKKVDDSSTDAIDIIINSLSRDFNIKVNLLNFVIFIVIKMSENIDNIIQYVNLNKLYYAFINYKSSKDKSSSEGNLKTQLDNIKNILTSIDYYNINYNNKGQESEITKLLNDKFDIENTEKLMSEIDNLNALTFIGSLNASKQIADIFSDKYNLTCSNLNDDTSFEDLKKIHKISDSIEFTKIIPTEEEIIKKINTYPSRFKL